MNGSIPPLPQYAFMAWCSVKAQEQLYLLQSYNSLLPCYLKLDSIEVVDAALVLYMFVLEAAGSNLGFVAGCHGCFAWIY
jgi:hypothetical protein